MAKILIAVSDPIVNVTQEHISEDCKCIFLNTQSGSGDVFQLLFQSKEDMEAYYGLLGMALGKDK